MIFNSNILWHISASNRVQTLIENMHSIQPAGSNVPCICSECPVCYHGMAPR